MFIVKCIQMKNRRKFYEYNNINFIPFLNLQNISENRYNHIHNDM